MTYSKTDMAILGMLTGGKMSGYDMKRFCEESLSYFWHESYGNLYPRLKRLAAAGLIRSRREKRPRAPDAILHALTPQGRARFLEWMAQPPEPDRVRSEFLLKIFFGAEAEPAVSKGWIREHEREQMRIRDGYKAAERMIRSELAGRAEAPFWLMALRRGQLLTEARLSWCREALATVGKLQAGEESS